MNTSRKFCISHSLWDILPLVEFFVFGDANFESHFYEQGSSSKLPCLCCFKQQDDLLFPTLESMGNFFGRTLSDIIQDAKKYTLIENPSSLNPQKCHNITAFPLFGITLSNCVPHGSVLYYL